MAKIVWHFLSKGHKVSVSLDDGEGLMLCEQLAVLIQLWPARIDMLPSNGGIVGSSGSFVDMVKLSSDLD
jgi:hypothetical protein